MVDANDVNGRIHMFRDIIHSKNRLYPIDGFDRVSTRQIVPYIPDEETPDIEGLTIKRVEGIRQHFHHGFYARFFYGFDHKLKATGALLRHIHDHARACSTYIRDSWPSGIRVSLSPQFLASNTKMSIEAAHLWKYELEVTLLTGDYYKIVERNFKWASADPEQHAIKSKGPGLLVQDHNRAFKNELVVLTPDNPSFKYMFDVQLDMQHATFSGHLAIENIKGREFIIGMPSHALSIQQ